MIFGINGCEQLEIVILIVGSVIYVIHLLDEDNMSTKIYNAFQYQGTVEELMKDFEIIHDEYKEAATNFIKQTLDKYDKLNPELNLKNEDGIIHRGNLSTLIKDHTMKEYPTYDDVYCFNASSMVYFLDGNVYIQFFGFDVAPFGAEFNIPHKNKLEEDKKITDFHYQDQTDPWYDYDELEGQELEDAEKDWKHREDVWNRIIGKKLIFHEVGLVKEFKLDAFMLVYELDS
jgi:hypothetical protein